jgi:hypothetical protein
MKKYEIIATYEEELNWAGAAFLSQLAMEGTKKELLEVYEEAQK